MRIARGAGMVMVMTNLAREPMAETYDVVMIGGGVAGLNGALMLGRSRRSVLVVDAGEPRNAPAAGVHGFLTRDGTIPAALLAAGRAEVGGYGVELLNGRVVSATTLDDGTFTVRLDDGRELGARRLLVASGLVDELPDVPGIRERLGRDVLHCPYCHGWEARDLAIGVLASGPFAVHQALLFAQWTADLTLFLHTIARPRDEEAEQLAARGITVVEGKVSALEVVEDRLAGVAAGQRRGHRLRGADGHAALCRPQRHPHLARPCAGAAINADLIAEDIRRAVVAHRERTAVVGSTR